MLVKVCKANLVVALLRLLWWVAATAGCSYSLLFDVLNVLACRLGLFLLFDPFGSFSNPICYSSMYFYSRLIPALLSFHPLNLEGFRMPRCKRS